MKNLKELDQYRIKHWMPQTEKSGAFKVFVGGRSFLVLASVDNIGEDGLWEHISVTPCSLKRKTCPTWEEMAAIKDMFFDAEDECIQYHPKHSRYVNYHGLCLHIWRPVDENLRYPDKARVQTLEERDRYLEQLWAEFADVPMDPDTECIEEDFLGFPHGTHREEIWKWFDERYSKGVHYLIYGFDGVDRTSQTTMLLYYTSLCDDCETKSCAYNVAGQCRYPMVHHRVPIITEEDGCTSGVIDPEWSEDPK